MVAVDGGCEDRHDFSRAGTLSCGDATSVNVAMGTEGGAAARGVEGTVCGSDAEGSVDRDGADDRIGGDQPAVEEGQ